VRHSLASTIMNRMLTLLVVLLAGGCATQPLKPEALIGRWAGTESERFGISLSVLQPGTNGSATVKFYDSVYEYSLVPDPHACPKCHNSAEFRFFLLPVESPGAPPLTCAVRGRCDRMKLWWSFRDAAGTLRLRRVSETTGMRGADDKGKQDAGGYRR
jgi:hypothetical protein